MNIEVNRVAHDKLAGGVDSNYAWLRLATAVLISTIGNVGLWSYVVALPAVQAEFGVTRAPPPSPTR